MGINKWFPERFSELAKERLILKSAYKQYIEDSIYIKFLYSPPFTKPFYLQMYASDNQLNISKSTLIEQDLEEQKEHVLIEEAEMSGTLVNQLLRLIKTAAWTIFSTKENAVNWRDGEEVELCVGRGFHETTFSWWLGIDPVDWTDLDALAHKILEIDKEASYTFCHKEYFELLLDESTDSLIGSKERSLLLMYKGVDEGSGLL